MDRRRVLRWDPHDEAHVTSGTRLHGLSRGGVGDAPGLTPLKGKYARPPAGWACYSGGSSFEFLSPTDRTDPLHGIVCVRLEDAALAAKIAYYAARALAILAG